MIFILQPIYYDIALADYTKGFSITHFLTLIHVKDYRLNTLLLITNMINQMDSTPICQLYTGIHVYRIYEKLIHRRHVLLFIAECDKNTDLSPTCSDVHIASMQYEQRFIVDMFCYLSPVCNKSTDLSPICFDVYRQYAI